jgi:hypothetical protein
MTHRPIAKVPRKNAVPLLLALPCAVLFATPAFAQNFCDLVPASAVKSNLGITTKLEAKPNTEGGNGCRYIESNKAPITLVANTSDASGMSGDMFTQRLASLGPNAQLIQGLGEAAYYSQLDNEQIPKFPGVTYTQQRIVFRAKGRIVSLLVTTPGTGVPKEALESLANFVASKPLDTLIDPS